MKFREVCRVSKSVRITLRVYDGESWHYYPEEITNNKMLHYTGVSWLTREACKIFMDYYVTSIEPTAHNYMNVIAVKKRV